MCLPASQSETVNNLQLTKLDIVLAGHGDSCEQLLSHLDTAAAADGTKHFATASYRFSVADHAGHPGFPARLLDTMPALGAAILVIDGERGVDRTIRQSAFLLNLIGIRQVVAAVTGLDDGPGTAAQRFVAIEQALTDWFGSVPGAGALLVPVAGSHDRAPAWHEGPCLLEALERVQPLAQPVDVPLRMPIVEVAGSNGERHYRARILTGLLDMGDTIMFSPMNQTARVVSLATEDGADQLNSAEAGETVRIALDQDLPIAPGELASHPDVLPVETDVFRVRMTWMSDRDLVAHSTYQQRRFGHAIPVTVQSIESVSANGRPNEMIEATIRTRSIIALDPFEACGPTGFFALYDGDDLCGAGQISMRGYADQRDLITMRATNVVRVEHSVTDEHRILRNGHRGAVLWLTGLSGAGKSTIAIEVERRLFEKGYQVYVLDGDNIRHGLNTNLGFSPEDRAENIRRVGEVGALFAKAGFIAITAFISPYRSDRDRARTTLPEGFHEIYIQADLSVCEERDPKGLYKKARAGEIPDFTGISAPYEVPEDPELIVDTSNSDVDECSRRVIEHIERHFALKPT